MFIARRYVYAKKFTDESVIVYRFSDEKEREKYIQDNDSALLSVQEKDKHVEQAIVSKLLWPVTISMKGG